MDSGQWTVATHSGLAQSIYLYLSSTKEPKLKASKQELYSIFCSNLLGKKSILRSQCVVTIMKKVKGKNRTPLAIAKREAHTPNSELRTPNSELRTQVSTFLPVSLALNWGLLYKAETLTAISEKLCIS